MKRIAIIPARGGSKRIPGKNIKDFLGKPIIVYSIEIALKSGLFDEVMVSTDDAEIATIAERYGAQVPFLRTAKNSDDHASTVDVINEVLNEYKSMGKIFEYACCIYPAAPLIRVRHLKEAYDKLIDEGLDSVFPVVPFSSPIWRGLRRVNEKTMMVWPEYMTVRTQDLETLYYDAGQWYWLKVSALKRQLWTDNTDTILLSEEEVQDIDYEKDWRMAELKFRMLNDG